MASDAASKAASKATAAIGASIATATGGNGTKVEDTNAPLIPLSLVDGPTQRVYVASAFVAVQTYKVYSILTGLYDEDRTSSTLGFALLLDFVFVVAVSRLRTPRIDYSRGRWTTMYALLGAVDWLMCGGWRTLLSLIASMPILGWIADFLINSWTDTFNRQMSISEHRVRLRDLIRPQHHILGQHTIHVLPYSTAAFAPSKSTSALSSCFCLDTSDAKAEVSVPVVFNNTEPQLLSYSVMPFESTSEDDKKVYNVTISKSALIRLGRDRRDGNGFGRDDPLDLELDDADDDEESDSRALVRRGESSALTTSSGQRKASGSPGKEMMYNLSIKRPGRIRLERVLDRNRFDARLSRSELLVVECPKMGFVQRTAVRDYCPGQDASIDLWISGLAPLELRYTRAGHGTPKHGLQKNNEQFTISQIADDQSNSPLASEKDRADKLALALRGAKQNAAKQSLRWAAAQNVSVPITIDSSQQGRRTYHLTSVRDACGNIFEGDERASRFLQDVLIHPRPTAVFDGCSSDRPIELLQGGTSREIGVRVQGDESDEGPFTAEIKFEGEGEPIWTHNVTFDRRTTVKVDRPGVYTIQSVKGKYCDGEAGSNWMCTAREVPPPTASIHFDPIQDPCAGPVGVKALAVLSGKVPFRVKYRVQRHGRPAQDHEQTIHRTREEIEFRPSAEGEVTYTFTGLSDANYQNLALDGPSFTQVLHPVAKASFDLTKRRQGEPDVILHSCQGDVAKAQLTFEGVGPFEVTYAVRGDGGELLETRTLKDIQSNTAPFELKLPSQVAAKGGQLTVSLVNVKDAKGCERPLTVPDLFIDVRRSKPSVSFVDPRQSSMLEGKKVQLPVRLVGEGPWTVRYRKRDQEGDGGQISEKTLHNADSLLDVDLPGAYEIIDVRDKYCPGTVVVDRGLHTVSVRARPEAKFNEDGLSVSPSSGHRRRALVRPPVCLGEQDSTLLTVQGHFPVSVTYAHRAPGNGDATSNSFNAAQKHTSLQLATNVEGKHTYEITQVGDAVYPPSSPQAHKADVAYLTLEQTVYALPFADFEQQQQQQQQAGQPKQVSLCLGEALSNKDKSGAAPTIIFTGQPPFTLEYAIKDSLGAVRKSLTKSDITSHRHALEVERADFPFDGTGRWSIDLVSVSDGNGCQRSLLAADTMNGVAGVKKRATIEIEVVEAANISPVGTRADYCVGETIDFVLQGSPPWSVEYTFEGRSSRATVKSTTFSRVAEQAGTLHVEAIAHQHNRCQTSVKNKAGMTKTVHALPTVHIREGNHFVEDLREGNQAEIVFRLDGQPPFSFTYQRTQAIDRFSRPQVLETHTVTNIDAHAYTITTAEEGTWSVIWLQDRYCAVSLDMSQGKATSQGVAKKIVTQSGVGGGSALKVAKKHP